MESDSDGLPGTAGPCPLDAEELASEDDALPPAPGGEEGGQVISLLTRRTLPSDRRPSPSVSKYDRLLKRTSTATAPQPPPMRLLRGPAGARQPSAVASDADA
jgi:hypothetical protein